ncbi:hypothetical protein DSL72_000142 [Monilinia vaccinii-corymbosi]|uniref:Uncharacterized protein n=1 Tax=Monilinia vaccinii-corymbosi TaxID=61207 RepID=A0A8A3P5A7_9HELO|nr:hypothetical protein DSL72_000142 [Monilinia vaccinii-corymbosi]
MAGIPFSKTSTLSTAKRLRRTRQNLGSYRYDLMIAMRVVNNIERNVLKAEWENWLLDENMRCKQAQLILRENRAATLPTGKDGKDGSRQKVLGEDNKMNELRKWHQDYCGSCKAEQDLLVGGEESVTFG